MDPLIGAGIYLILWWVAFFIVLPVGVRNHDEAGVETEPGVERAAPAKPMIWIKAIWAAGLAFVLWLGVYFAAQYDLINLRGT